MRAEPLRTGCDLMVLGLLRKGHHLVGADCGKGPSPVREGA